MGLTLCHPGRRHTKVRAKLAQGGTAPLGNTPEEFATMIGQQIELVGKIVKSAGIVPAD
jgi:tripartite-type tricarboxylate transporter receptor subunit TctC